MPSTVQRALPRFPGAIVGQGVVSVTIAGGVATISLTSGPGSDPTVSQYLRALATYQVGAPAALDGTIAADKSDPNRIIFDHTVTVAAGGAYETLVASTLKLTTAALAAIRTLALTLQP